MPTAEALLEQLATLRCADAAGKLRVQISESASVYRH